MRVADLDDGSTGGLQQPYLYAPVLTPVAASQAPVSGGGNLADFLAIGDSITAWNTDQANNVYADSWPTHAALQSNGKLRLVRNAGVGGNTTTQMLARFAAEILAYAKPGAWLGIMGGTNDTDGITDTYPNIESMIQQAYAARLRVFLLIPPPVGTAAISPPTVTATPSTTGGTLSAATYAYRVSAINGAGETLAAAEVPAMVIGTTGSVTLTWPHVQGATSYKVYGRTSGAQLLMGTVTVASNGCTYTDTGAATPSGALPSSNTTAVAAGTPTKIARVRQTNHRLARKYGCPLINTCALLSDTTTGLFQTGLTVDGTHPTPVAQRLIGSLVSTTLGPFLAPQPILLPTVNTDATYLNSNLLFQTNNGSVPSGWGPYNGSAAESMQTVVGISGSAHQTARTDYTGRFSGAPTITSGFAVGDRLAFTGKLSVSGIDTASGTITLEVGYLGVSLRKLASLKLTADTGGVMSFYFEDVVPAGVTGLSLSTVVALGPVTLQIGQLAIVNLTALGIS